MLVANSENFWLIILVVLLSSLMASSFPRPGEHSRVRIHIPVKHHTHFHTKTVVKKVPVPVPVPVKQEHHFDEDDEEEEYESYIVPKKKLYHPFV